MKKFLLIFLFITPVFAQQWPNVPIVSGDSYSCGQNNGVSDCTVPAGPPAITGDETIPLDTNLPNGEDPQTAKVTINTLKTFIGTSFVLTNGTGGTVFAGAPVYISSSNTYNLGEANSYSTSGVIGLVFTNTASLNSGIVVLSGILTLTASQWDNVAGTSGGLTAGSIYFLNPSTPGKLTSVVPTTPGQVITYIGRAISSTTFLISIQPPIQL